MEDGRGVEYNQLIALKYPGSLLSCCKLNSSMQSGFGIPLKRIYPGEYCMFKILLSARGNCMVGNIAGRIAEVCATRYPIAPKYAGSELRPMSCCCAAVLSEPVTERTVMPGIEDGALVTPVLAGIDIPEGSGN